MMEGISPQVIAEYQAGCCTFLINYGAFLVGVL